jgi:hypothetical protein
MITVFALLFFIDLGITIDNHYKIKELEIIQRFGNFPSCSFPLDPRWRDYEDQCGEWPVDGDD